MEHRRLGGGVAGGEGVDLVHRLGEDAVPVHDDAVPAPEDAEVPGLVRGPRDLRQAHRLERAADRRHRPPRPFARVPREQLLAPAPGRDQADAGLHEPRVSLRVGDDRVTVQQDFAPSAQRHAGRGAHHREGSVLHRPERALPELGRRREQVPCPGADREQRFAEVGPGGEVLPVVVDDQPREPVRHDVQCLSDELQDRLVERIHPGMEFEAGDVAAGVPEACGVVPDHPLAAPFHVGQPYDAPRRDDGDVAAGGADPSRIGPGGAGPGRPNPTRTSPGGAGSGGADFRGACPGSANPASVSPGCTDPGGADLLDAPAGLAVEAAFARRREQRGRRPALGAEPIREPAGADPIRQLEGSRAPVVAEPHRGIDVGDVVGDLRHQRGRVREHRREHPPRIAPLLAVVLDQRPRPAGLRGLDARRAGALGAAVLAGGQIDRLLDPLPALAPQPVEPALPLPAGVAAGDHAPEHLGHLHVAAQCISGRQQGVHAPGHVGHQVEADEVEEPEHPGLRDPRGRPQRRVRLLHAQPRLDRLDECALQPEHPDAVGDEPRRVLALHHPLAEAPVGEVAELLDQVRPGRRAAHDLQQPHVARRVEEVGDREVPLQRGRGALGEPGQRDGRGVRGDDGAGLAHRVEPRVEVAFHVQALHHRLDDPVRLPRAGEVVVEVAGVDAAGRAAVHEGGGVRLRQALDRRAGDGGAVRPLLCRDVEQEDPRPGVREVGGDPAAHHPRADDRDPLDGVQPTASSTVAIPCPPPMHWVARA